MNRVYKVIWSKAKHCYVVTSEIARSVTKSASAGKKGAAVLAMAFLLFTAGGVVGHAANVTDVTAGSAANVITVTKDDSTSADIAINDVAHAKEADYATAATKAYSDGNGEVIHNIYAKKAYVENDYVKKTDAQVGTDGNYVKTAKKVGENLSALDTQVKANADAVTAEENARKAADKDNLKVDGDGVISKVTGDDGTTSSPVNKLVLNKDGDNQITMDENGIKVGKNSTTMDENGFYAGSDYNYGTAKAALDATEGKIRGADGKFEVNTEGKVTAKGGVDTDGGEILTHNGNINAGSGDISGKDITAFGSLHADGDISGKDITGKDITGSGTVTGHAVTDGTARMEGGALTGVTTITATGNISTGGDVVSTGGKVQGTSISDSTATLSGGSLTGAVNITASGTITGNNVVVNEKLTTKNLEVTDGLKTDHITLGDETLNQTDINKGKVTSKIHEISGAVEYTAESSFNKDGSSITVRTDEGAVDSTGNSTVGSQIITQYLGNNAVPGGNNVTRRMVRNDNGTFSMVDTAVNGKDKYSIVSQNAEERMVTVVEGIKKLNVTENLTNGIVSKTKGDDGTVTLTQGMNGTYKVETSGTSTEEIGGQKIENYKGGLATEITGSESHHVTENQTITVDGTLDETVTGNVTEDFKADLSTKVGGDETHAVTGNQTTTVSGNRTVNVKGTETENFNAQVTNVKTDQKTSVGGNQTNIVTGNQQNTVSGSKTETVKKAVTEKYGSQATTVDGDQSTNVGGNQSNVVKGNQTNTISGNKTETVKGEVTEKYGSLTTEVKGESKLSAANITNSAKEKLSNSAADIKNSATESITDKVGENVKRTMTTNKISESVKDGTKSNSFSKTAERDINIITDGTNTSTLSQLSDKVNTSLKEVDGDGKTTKSLNNVKTVSEDTTKMTDAASGAFSKRSQTVSQIQDKVGKTTVTTIDGKTTLTDEDHNHTTEMDYANVTKDLSVERNTTLGKEGEDTKLTVNSKSEFKDTVKMDSTLEVDGTSIFNDKVTITKNGLDVTGGTTTDTLEVKETSEFGGKAAFKDDVSMDKKLTVKGAAEFKDDVSMGKNLTVTGKTETGTLHVNGDGYVGGDLNVEGNIETHDAELSENSRQVVTGRQLYQTNERVDRLDNRIKKVGANAAALAALRPGDFNPDDKFSIAAGFGSYRNASAAAIGLFYRPNENVLLSLGTSFGDGENMVNAGVSVKFGRGKSMAERRKEMADEVSSMRDEMRSQNERIAELEEMLRKQSELIEKLSKEES